MVRLTTYLDLESLEIQRSGFDFKLNLTSAIGDLANRDILASYVSCLNAMAYDTRLPTRFGELLSLVLKAVMWERLVNASCRAWWQSLRSYSSSSKKFCIGMDIFFVNGHIFFMTYSRKICFMLVTHLINHKVSKVWAAMHKIYQMYHCWNSWWWRVCLNHGSSCIPPSQSNLEIGCSFWTWRFGQM